MRLIDADDLTYESIDSCDTGYHESKYGTGIVAIRKEDIDDAPTIELNRKKGKWINHRNDDGHNIADCDQCGNAIQWFDGDEIPRYCCMCGTDMREGDVE